MTLSRMYLYLLLDLAPASMPDSFLLMPQDCPLRISAPFLYSQSIVLNYWLIFLTIPLYSANYESITVPRASVK